MGLNPIAMIGAFLGPSLVFILVSGISSSELRHGHGGLSLIVCLVILCGIIVFIATPNRTKLLNFMTFTLIFAWIVGLVYGDSLYTTYFQPYLDVVNLNTYPSVNPARFKGSQLMDAGVIEFVPGSHLDLTKTYGFKNGDTYCVAPVVGPQQSGKQTTPPTYDFWAVGTNCCTGHSPNEYRCGEFANPMASKGLRLMRDDQRNFFRLAVEEAVASYNIRADHPVFMYWMDSPSAEINAYQDDGSAHFLSGVISFLLFQACITVIAFVAVM